MMALHASASVLHRVNPESLAKELHDITQTCKIWDELPAALLTAALHWQEIPVLHGCHQKAQL